MERTRDKCELFNTNIHAVHAQNATMKPMRRLCFAPAASAAQI